MDRRLPFSLIDLSVPQFSSVTKETMNEKYLGLPVHVGQSKMKTFGYLKDRIWKRMQGWNEKFLS